MGHRSDDWREAAACLLGVLHSPLVVRQTPLGAEPVGLRRSFLSQLADQTYSDYVLSQFTKLEPTSAGTARRSGRTSSA